MDKEKSDIGVSRLSCCVKVEPIQTSSPATKKMIKLSSLNVNNVMKQYVFKKGELILSRNGVRDLVLIVRDTFNSKSNKYTFNSSSDIHIYRNFVGEGKMSIRFRRDGIVLMISNAAPHTLAKFAQTLVAKIATDDESTCDENQNANKNLESPILKRRKMVEAKSKLFSGYVHQTEEISPVTTDNILAFRKAERNRRGLLRIDVNSSPQNNGPNSQLPPSPLTGFVSSKVSMKRKRLNENIFSHSDGELTRDQREALNAVVDGKRNVFITGGAGTGKSFLIKRLIGALPKDLTYVSASTGVAAFQIGGVTLHAFAGCGSPNLNATDLNEEVNRLVSVVKRRQMALTSWRQCGHLIIDEISMVDGVFFTILDGMAKLLKRCEKPFGGIQLIVIGDFFQLPPVSSSDSKRSFCFESPAWDPCFNSSSSVVVLKSVKRQSDDSTFIRVLNEVRRGKCTSESENLLTETRVNYFFTQPSNDDESEGRQRRPPATKLCTHTQDVKRINDTELSRLESTIRTFEAVDSDPSKSAFLNVNTPVEQKLTLKEGAEVMLIRNKDINVGLVNGARGRIIGFDKSNQFPIVQFYSTKEGQSDQTLTVEAVVWPAKVGGSGASEKFLTRKQLPLKLAWAFSIHKAQGMTLDNVEVCLSRIFECGQAYVALSRARTLSTLRVTGFSTSCIKAHPKVVRFYRNLESCLPQKVSQSLF